MFQFNTRSGQPFGNTNEESPEQIIQKNLGPDFETFKRITEQFNKASEDHKARMIEMDLKFKKDTHSICHERSKFLRKIPKFWATCLSNHEDVKYMLMDRNGLVREFLEKYWWIFLVRKILFCGQKSFFCQKIIFDQKSPPT